MGGVIFHMGEVSELWRKTMINTSHVFNLSNCSVVFKMYNNSFSRINGTLLKKGCGLVCQCVKRHACGYAARGMIYVLFPRGLSILIFC